jgi:glycosyltransferase involved in cell wall biosynthesis
MALDAIHSPSSVADRRPHDAPRVSVVIPTLNEAGNLPHVLPRIPSWIHELILVDGLSRDDTVAVAKEHAPRAKVLMEGTRGKGAALRAGFAEAEGDIIVMLDADGSTDPREIAAFVGLLVAGADVVMGSRFALGGGTDDMETHRKVGNWFLTRLVRAGFGARYSDLCYGYTAFWRDVLPALDGPFRGFEVETVLHIRAVRAGLRIAEVPSFEKLRISGTTNLRTVRDGFRVLRAITTEWRDERVTRTSGSPHPAAPGRAARPTEAPPWHSNGRSAAEPSADGNGARIRSVGG